MKTTSVIVAAMLLTAGGPAAAQSLVPGPNQAGRYQMQAVAGGIARLDTVTGDVSLCRVENGTLRCRPSEDADAAGAQDEEAAPKDQARRDPDPDAFADDEAAPSRDRPSMEQGDSTDAELDKAIGRVKRVFRAFRDIAREFDREDGGAQASPDRT